jgi:hypothetical protein
VPDAEKLNRADSALMGNGNDPLLMGIGKDLPRVCPATDRERSGSHPKRSVQKALVTAAWGQRCTSSTWLNQTHNPLLTVVPLPLLSVVPLGPWSLSWAAAVYGRPPPSPLATLCYAIWSTGHEQAAQRHPRPVWILLVPDPEQRPSRASEKVNPVVGRPDGRPGASRGGCIGAAPRAPR